MLPIIYEALCLSLFYRIDSRRFELKKPIMSFISMSNAFGDIIRHPISSCTCRAFQGRDYSPARIKSRKKTLRSRYAANVEYISLHPLYAFVVVFVTIPSCTELINVSSISIRLMDELPWMNVEIAILIANNVDWMSLLDMDIHQPNRLCICSSIIDGFVASIWMLISGEYLCEASIIHSLLHPKWFLWFERRMWST